MKRGDWKMTVEILTSGQARAYADTIFKAKVTFEWIPIFTNEPEEFLPVQWSEDVIKAKLLAVKYWYDNPPNDFVPKLDYIKKISDGIWEFQVRELYDD